MKTLVPCTLLLLAAACGDNETPDVLPDGSIDPSVDAAPAPPRAVVVTPSSGFMAGQPGVLSEIDVTARTVRPNIGPAMAVGSDPVVRKFGNELLIVNRADNNVTILDAVDYSLITQVGTGPGTNPQDVAIVDDKVFVPSFSGKGVLELLRNNASHVVEIDLSADDPDGKPNCNSIYRVNNQLYVACELLDDTNRNLPPRGAGKIYVIDATTRAVTGEATLGTANPFNLFQQIPDGAPNAGDLVIGTIDFASGAGCLERIGVGATPTAAGCVLTNQDLGGYASRVGYGAGKMYALIYKPDFTSMVRSFDLQTSTLGPAFTMSGESPGDVAACDSGHVVVSDAPFGGTGGVRVYEGTTEQTTMPLPVGLNPASIAGLVCY